MEKILQNLGFSMISADVPPDFWTEIDSSRTNARKLPDGSA
jgi:hypothetical protein